MKKDLKNSCDCFDNMKSELQSEICQLKLNEKCEYDNKKLAYKNSIAELNDLHLQEENKLKDEIILISDK